MTRQTRPRARGDSSETSRQEEQPLLEGEGQTAAEAGTEEKIPIGITTLAFLFPALGGALFGYDIGATSGAVNSLQDAARSGTDFGPALSDLQSGLIVSGSLIGALLSSTIAVFFGDGIGRKRELVSAGVLYLMGALGMSTSPGFGQLVLARGAYGLGIGLAMHGAPIYISETAPASIRGTLVSAKEAVIVSGIMAGYLTSFAFVEQTGGWRLMWGISGPLALAFGAGMAFLPDSPRWLLKMRQSDEQARKALARLRNKSEQDVDPELKGMQAATVSGEEASPDAARQQLGRLFRGGDFEAAKVAFSLMLFQQITGQPSVLYYATDIVQKAGFSSASAASFVSVGLGVVKFVCTLFAVSSVDRFGRRPLLIGGVGALTLSLLLLGSLSYSESQYAAYLSVASILLYTGAYQASFGPISWLITGEVFSTSARSAAVGGATIVNFGSNALVSFFLPRLQGALGQGGTYFFFSGLGVLALITIITSVPETKGRSLEEIQTLFLSKSSSSRDE